MFRTCRVRADGDGAASLTADQHNDAVQQAKADRKWAPATVVENRYPEHGSRDHADGLAIQQDHGGSLPVLALHVPGRRAPMGRCARWCSA